MSDPVSEEKAPALRIVNADATPEEVAAIVAVFSSLGTGSAPAKKPVPRWAAADRRTRTPISHGRGGWRASGLPR